MSAASFAGAQLGALLGDAELGGIACFASSQLEVAAAARSFDDALYVLGDAVAIV